MNIEQWPLTKIIPYARNPRKNESAVAAVKASIKEFGFRQPIVVDRDGVIVAGHTRYLAAQQLELKTVPVHIATELTPIQIKAYRLADNRTAQNATWNDELLGLELEELKADDFDLDLTGFTDDELVKLLDLDQAGTDVDAEPQIDRAEELRAQWGVESGQLWSLGQHRLICGDCRDPNVWARLLGGVKVNGVFTSPPYAEQRKEQYGGVPVDKYVAWWEVVQANVKTNIAPNGSFFVNIKPHSEDGERVLYTFDLVISMKRRWGWRFVDELCWRNTKNGVPGTWPNRLKNGFEPIYHFSLDCRIKFTPKQAGNITGGTFNYHPLNQKSRTATPFIGARKYLGYHEGVSLPSNVIDAPAEGAGIHQAPFPIALPDFFIRVYSDAGDTWLDPFLGSGTTIMAANRNNRRGYGIELLPEYVAVALQRFLDATEITPEKID